VKNIQRFVVAGIAAAMLLTACAPEVVEESAPPEGDVTAGDDAATDEATGEELEAEGESDADLTIAFVSHTQDITDLFGQLKIGFEDTLAEAGIEYELISGAPPASDNHEAMDRILTDLQSAQPDYIVFGPSSFELNQPRLVDLEEQGTKIIMTDYEPPEEGFEIAPLTWVIYDHYEMGRLAGSTVAQDMCDAGNDGFEVAMFWGPGASEISEARGGGAIDGMDEVTEDCGIGYELVEEVFAEFNREMAFNLAENVITAHPNLDVLIGANSNTALGIMEALLAEGELEGRDIVGMGGQLDEMAAICRGDIHNAPFRDSQDMGRLAAEALIADLEGRSDEIPETSQTDLPVLTDCENVFELVDRAVLEQDDFRNNLLEGQWEEFAA
jgi:ABC-type sugar transport system substrate-binding protein